MAAKITVQMKGLDTLIARAEATRLYRRPLARGLRKIGKAMKANVVALARPISRSLARRVRVQLDRDYPPQWVKVINRAAWIHVAERGRRAGAKAPPVAEFRGRPAVGRIRGGYPSAQLIKRRGLPGHHVMERAAAASQRDVMTINREISREMEAVWNARGRR